MAHFLSSNCNHQVKIQTSPKLKKNVEVDSEPPQLKTNESIYPEELLLIFKTVLIQSRSC